MSVLTSPPPTMKTFIRQALLLALLPFSALAQPTDYPTRAIKLVVPVPPGGAADAMARMIAEHLQAKWGQPVVIENKPGAG